MSMCRRLPLRIHALGLIAALLAATGAVSAITIAGPKSPPRQQAAPGTAPAATPSGEGAVPASAPPGPLTQAPRPTERRSAAPNLERPAPAAVARPTPKAPAATPDLRHLVGAWNVVDNLETAQSLG